MQTPHREIPNIPNTPELGTALSSGPARPVVLFPVRLETRFFPQTGGNVELRVRVYPDQVHLDSHEPGLTADELVWGRHFWEQTWRAGNEEERRKAAWRQLADRFDPPRASWIARALTPMNSGDRPVNPVPPDHALPKAITFPNPATKPDAWTRAPEARMLPNHWVMLGYKDGQLIVNVKGGAIPDRLPAGPDPSPSAVSDQQGIDTGMSWMVNFEAAEQVGMGMRATLSKDVAAGGLDFLLVVGIKDGAGASTDWAPHFVQWLDAHRYTDGLSFVPHGTPSNNTQDTPSGFSSNDFGHDISYVAEQQVPIRQSGDGSNADVLAAALGLAKASAVLTSLPHAQDKEQLDARHMNTALWQATWGYFLLQLLGVGEGSESPLTDEDIAWTRDHFINFVRANGPLPALRIGKQPYGVLPVTSLIAWKPSTAGEGQGQRDIVLRDWLVRLREVWRRQTAGIPRLGRSDDPTSDLAQVLSMDGLSSSYSIRNVMGRQYIEHLWVFLTSTYFEDVWGIAPLPPEPVAPVEEPPEPELTPKQRAEWIRRQDEARRAYRAAHQTWLNEKSRHDNKVVKESAISAWKEAQTQASTALLHTLRVTWRPRLSHARFAPPVVMLDNALVQTNLHVPLSPNYIESLLAVRDLEAIRFETLQPRPPRTLLYQLLRHSMLQEYSAAASRVLIKRGLMQPGQRREPELVNMPTAQEAEVMKTVWEQLKTNIEVSGVAGKMEIGKYLLGFASNGEPDVAREPDLKSLSEFRASLTHLKSLSPARLEQLLAGTLDLCSHRLDAWITSFATKRLAEMRQTGPAGVLIGGYGWAVNLKPADALTEVPPPSGEQAPVFHSAGNPGFIHTPSLAQASTVAVLRSGHLAHAGKAPTNPLAIDLSSERARLASWLLDGVRQGQSLGSLLGYRFERRLQEAHLAQFIAPFRELAPLVARKLEPTTDSVETIASNNVVDGLELHRRWQVAKGSGGSPLSSLLSPLKNKPETKTAKESLESALDSLADSVDAVSDALMAESVYQTVRGNPLRATSTVESIAGGESPPPELEVLRTPRTGVALTHRLVALFNDGVQLRPEWVPSGGSPRANAEPHLNAWVSALLGNPTHTRCVVERVDPETGVVAETKDFRLSQLLNLAPLDFIYAVEGGSGDQQGEIEQRILYAVMRLPDSFPSGSLLRLNPGRKPEWTAAELSYGEFSELLRVVRRLISGVRHIGPDDLDVPERRAGGRVDITELEERADRSVAELRRVLEELHAQVAASTAVNAEGLRELIIRAAGFGIAGAMPVSAVGGLPIDRQELGIQTESIERELGQRVEQLKKMAEGFDASRKTPEDRQEFAFARLRGVFGKSFVVLSRFTPANAAELEKSLADGVRIQDGDALAVVTWFQRMARVREGVGRLSAALTYSEALNTGEKLKLAVAQLPYVAGDRWVGLPLNDGQRLPGGKLSLVVQSTTQVDVRRALVGLLIDEWVEVVPNATETTGIALQYDQPNAAPPQAILVAVPPETEVPWTVWSLQQVLMETLDLARIRAVDPDALGEVGHYLPAVYVAANTVGDAVSTDFAAPE